MELLIAFVTGLVALLVFWAIGLGGMVSLLIMLAILGVGILVRMLDRSEA